MTNPALLQPNRANRDRMVVAACTALCLFAFAVTLSAQSGHSTRATDSGGSILTVTAWRTDKKADPIKPEDLFLYENGVEQKIMSFSYDPSPSRIVILTDNSKTLPIDIEKLKAATMEFAYEIFEGDQLFVLAYDEKAEIVQEWTDDAKKVETALGTYRKKGNPYLFDALESTLNEVLLPLMPGTRKTAIVVIGDGLDRGSKSQFDTALADLQNSNVTIYFLQIPDRSGGAYRRDQPKAAEVVTKLAEGTGGKVFPLEDAREAAKFICDELRKNRYLLSYAPINTSAYDAKRVLLMADTGIEIRTKAAQPPNIKSN